MSKEASEQYVLERVLEYLDFSVKYMRYTRLGEHELARETLYKYEQRLVKLRMEVNNV